ncbi:MAG TPA: hypothetical protein VGR61_03460 [Candidatus Dormibacteraeota bacterium]|nr:hypothetical protein [Candidatus Dormibacteraeota bacterium]
MIHEAAVEYAGAVADGEMELVPADALTHIRSCSVCTREVRWQREANTSLAGALSAEAATDTPPPAVHRSTRWRQRLPAPALVAGIAAAAVLLATAGVLSVGRHGGDAPVASGAEAVMTAAEHAYGSPPALASTDATAVADWTAAHGMAGMKPPTVAGTSLSGVRGWSVGGRAAVTFVYANQAGQTEVTALGGPPPAGWPMAEVRIMGGHAVGVVEHGATTGMVIVAPDEANLARAMAAVQ